MLIRNTIGMIQETERDLSKDQEGEEAMKGRRQADPEIEVIDIMISQMLKEIIIIEKAGTQPLIIKTITNQETGKEVSQWDLLPPHCSQIDS
jgi:hypothetical protein